MKYVEWKTRLKIFCQITKSERSQLNFRVRVKVGQHVQILCSLATLHWSQTSNTEHSTRDQQHHFHLHNIRTEITWKHFSSSVVSTIRSRVKHNSRSSLSYHNDNGEDFYEIVQENEDEVRDKLLSVLYLFPTPNWRLWSIVQRFSFSFWQQCNASSTFFPAKMSARTEQKNSKAQFICLCIFITFLLSNGGLKEHSKQYCL